MTPDQWAEMKAEVAALNVLVEKARREAELRSKGHAEFHQESQRALDVAAANVERRLESMNEFRDQLRDQQATFATRESIELMNRESNNIRNSHEQRIRALEQLSANLQGRGWAVGVAAGLIAILVSVAIRFI